MVTIAVTGYRGMLGRRVMERFPDAVPVAVRSDGTLHDPIRDAIEAIDPDWVINCAGATEHEPDTWAVNAVLPHRIAHRWRLIQPSTDHVADDTEYARSKALGECGHVIRCAIVDPDGGTLARARKQDTYGQPQREWNGITAKAWADVAADVIAGHHGLLVIPGSPTITHYGLLQTARRVFGWHTRTLTETTSDWTAAAPTLLLPPIEEQLRAYL